MPLRETMKQATLEFDRVPGISFFQGSYGITLPMSKVGNTFFLYTILGVTTAIVSVHLYVEHSKFGYGLKAIREAEDVAQIAGVNTTLVKLQAYVISAFFLAVFGGVEAYWIGYITPGEVYNVHKTVQMVIMSLLGGMGTVSGPVVGAVFLTMIYELLGATFVEYYLILVGLIIVGVTVAMPTRHSGDSGIEERQEKQDGRCVLLKLLGTIKVPFFPRMSLRGGDCFGSPAMRPHTGGSIAAIAWSEATRQSVRSSNLTTEGYRRFSRLYFGCCAPLFSMVIRKGCSPKPGYAKWI